MNNILQNCFNCQNRIPCWHVKDVLPEGRDPKKFKINKLSLLKFFIKRTFDGSYETLFSFEYFCIRSVIDMLNPALSKEQSNSYTQQAMGMIESMVNASGTGWCCPAEDQEIGEDFKFVAIEEMKTDVNKTYDDKSTQ